MLYALVVMEPGLTDEDLQSIRTIAMERREAGGVSAARLVLELSGRLPERLSLQEAFRDFRSVIDRVATERVHFDLERDDRMLSRRELLYEEDKRTIHILAY